MTLGEWAEWFSIYGPRPNRANWPKTYPPCLVCQKKSVNFFLFPHFICKKSHPHSQSWLLCKSWSDFFHFLSLILLWQSQFFSKKLFSWNTSGQAGLAQWYFFGIVWNWRSLDVCFVHLGSSEIVLKFFKASFQICFVLPQIRTYLTRFLVIWRQIIKYILCQGWHLLSLFFLEFPCGILKSPATDVGSVQ